MQKAQKTHPRKAAGRRPSRLRHPVAAALWERRARADALARAEREKWARNVVDGQVQRRCVAPWVFRHRRILLVLPAALTLAVLRVVAPVSSDWDFLLALLVVMGLGTVWATRCTNHSRAALAATFAACVWWVAPTRPNMTTVLWVAATATVMVIRGRHFRRRPTPALPDTWREDRWDAFVAGPGKILAGSRLTQVEDLHAPDGEVIGWQAVVQLPPGEKNADHVKNARGLISSAYQMGGLRLVIDGFDDDDSRAHIAVLDPKVGGNPLGEPQPFHQPSMDALTGVYVHGIRPDRTPAEVQLWHPEHGAKMGWISGSTGNGKSGSMDTLLVEATSTGLVHPLVIDMKGGTSLTDWEGVAGSYIDDPYVALEMLAGVKRLVQARQRQLREHRIIHPETGEDLGAAKCLPVSPLLPYVLVVIEEAPVLWAETNKAAVALVEYLVTQGRAGMVGTVLVSQDTTERGAFGNSGVIRNQVRSGYVIIHKNAKEAGEKTAESALKIDPSTIPPLPGSGYVLSCVDRRDSLMRTRWVQYPAKWARQAVIPPLDEASAEALKPLPPAEKPPEAVQPALEPGRMGERELFLRDLLRLVLASEGPFRTKTAVEHFRGRSSDDTVQRGLDLLKKRGDISDAGHGLWSRPLQEAVK